MFKFPPPPQITLCKKIQTIKNSPNGYKQTSTGSKLRNCQHFNSAYINFANYSIKQ
jgi:hypothetical protein